MPRHLRSGYLFAACAVFFSCTPSASASQAPWAEVKGDVAGYAQSKLPIPGPVVVYVYTSSGSLVGVIETHGAYDASAMQKVEAAIDTRDFHGFKGSGLSGTAEALKEYLSDQGHRVENIVSKHTPYTLLLTVLGVKSEACASALKIRDQYEQAIRHAVERPSARGVYTVDMLELGSSTVKIECKK